MDVSKRTLDALTRLQIDGAEAAREMGYERVARLPRMGSAALRELFPEAFEGRAHLLSAEELGLIREWYHAALDSDPSYLGDADRRLADKVAAWLQVQKRPPA